MGNIDLKSYHSQTVITKDNQVKEVHYGADYIFCERYYSPELYTKAVEKVCDYYRLPVPKINIGQAFEGRPERAWVDGTITVTDKPPFIYLGTEVWRYLENELKIS